MLVCFLDFNMKVSQMKERMQQKLKLQQQQRDAALAATTQHVNMSSIAVKTAPQVFSTGEVVERTPVEASGAPPSNSNKKKKKK
jgi:RecA/RadA recombinase